MPAPPGEFYRRAADGTEVDRHVYPDGQWVFFGERGGQPMRRVELALTSRGGRIERIGLRFECPAGRAELIAAIPDPGPYDWDLFAVDHQLDSALELSMTEGALARHGQTLLDIRDWNRRATFAHNVPAADSAERTSAGAGPGTAAGTGAVVYPAVDLRCYRLERFAQLQSQDR
ncbi:MAG: hypothetical protein AAGC55_25460 [Myxococcota bacterium]